jgi:hypothetical protein
MTDSTTVRFILSKTDAEQVAMFCRWAAFEAAKRGEADAEDRARLLAAVFENGAQHSVDRA